MRCANQFCNKILEPRQGQEGFNPKRKFCNPTCRTRENSLKRHFANSENQDFLMKKRARFRDWYQRNKEKQRENTMRDYYKNKGKWQERQFVDRYKIKIWNFLGRKCRDCNQEAKEVNHLTYDFPKRDRGLRGERHEEYLRWYCKFLEPLCVLCHKGKKKGNYKVKTLNR